MAMLYVELDNRSNHLQILIYLFKIYVSYFSSLHILLVFFLFTYETENLVKAKNVIIKQRIFNKQP